MPGGDGSDRSGGQWRAETQPNGTGRTDRTGEGRSGRNRPNRRRPKWTMWGGMWAAATTAATTAATAAATAATAATNIRVLLPCLPASSFLFWMPPSFFGCLRSSFLALLSNRTLCLRCTRRCPRRRLAHLRLPSRLRPTCIPLASSSLALDASFALGRPCASFLIWMPCASILFWRPQSMFGCPRPCCAPFPSSSPFGRDSPLIGCLRPWIS